jgi:hypothetical protein
MGPRGIAAAGLCALIALAVGPRSVVAECATDGIAPTMDDFVGHAFTATVLDISDRVDPPIPGASPFDWRVVFAVTHVYRGSPPARIVANGWDAGCDDIPQAALTVGGEVFMSTDRFGPADDPRFFGRLLLWQRVGNGWKFYDAAVGDVEGPPAVAADATTTDAILRLVAPDALPETATQLPARAITNDTWLVALILVTIFGLVGCHAAERLRAPRP